MIRFQWRQRRSRSVVSPPDRVAAAYIALSAGLLLGTLACGLATNYQLLVADLPPLNGTASRERIWGWSKPREATNATRKEGTG